MSDGGPHGDKWNKFAFSTETNTNAITSDQVLAILNLTPDGYYAKGSPLTLTCSDGTWLFVGYYEKITA